MKTGKETRVGELSVIRWNSCYETSWKGVIVPEAFAHP